MKFELKELESTVRKADLLSFHDSVSEDTESKTVTALNVKHLQLTPCTKHGYILYIYLIQTIKLYVKMRLKTLENTPIKSVINLTSYKIHICNILVS